MLTGLLMGNPVSIYTQFCNSRLIILVGKDRVHKPQIAAKMIDFYSQMFQNIWHFTTIIRKVIIVIDCLDNYNTLQADCQ